MRARRIPWSVRITYVYTFCNYIYVYEVLRRDEIKNVNEAHTRV